MKKLLIFVFVIFTMQISFATEIRYELQRNAAITEYAMKMIQLEHENDQANWNMTMEMAFARDKFDFIMNQIHISKATEILDLQSVRILLETSQQIEDYISDACDFGETLLINGIPVDDIIGDIDEVRAEWPGKINPYSMLRIARLSEWNDAIKNGDDIAAELREEIEAARDVSGRANSQSLWDPYFDLL